MYTAVGRLALLVLGLLAPGAGRIAAVAGTAGSPADRPTAGGGAAASAALDEHEAVRLREIEQLKRELAELGVSEEDVEAARKQGSSICAVM